MGRSLKVGDCFAIPLPDSRYAYCQYLTSDEENGALFRVYDKIDSRPTKAPTELRTVGEMFPPIFIGLRSVRSGRWKFIGNLPVQHFVFPTFRGTFATTPGAYQDWTLWNGSERRHIGALPPELRPLEIELVWGDELVEERIVSGKNPFGGIQ